MILINICSHHFPSGIKKYGWWNKWYKNETFGLEWMSSENLHPKKPKVEAPKKEEEVKTEEGAANEVSGAEQDVEDDLASIEGEAPEVKEDGVKEESAKEVQEDQADDEAGDEADNEDDEDEVKADEKPVVDIVNGESLSINLTVIEAEDSVAAAH